jgi:myosin protein heavy chain
VQQRTANAEMEAQKGQIREFTHTKKQLQKEVSGLREQLEGAKNEASSKCSVSFNE